MKKTVLAIAAVLAVGGIALVADAHPRGRATARAERAQRNGLGAIARLPRMKAELGLTDRQVEQIREAFKDLREKNAPYREELRGDLREVTETLLANPADVDEAQQLLRRHAAARDAMKANMLAATARALSVLTPEQRMKLATRIAERPARRGRR